MVVETAGQDARRATVWVVDDSPMAAAWAARMLTKHYSVESFLDAGSMLERLSRVGPPDLLVLDWEMPGISGVEACRFVRQTFDQAKLPILILTGSPDILVECLREGANDFARKPAHEPELLARAASLIRTKILYQDLARADAVLRTEAAMRERFVGILGHDLRQPLSTLLMAISLMDKENAVPAEQALLERMGRASATMHRMICDLLDFTRARHGDGIPVSRRDVDLHQTVRHVVDDLAASYPNRVLRLEIEGNGRGSWDFDRLAQLFGNLVENAIEYSALGTPVNITVRDQSGNLKFEVCNEGPAIPADLIPTLFEPFKRERSSGSKGLGLGLFIAQQVARAHGGSVGVESDGQHTRFVATLPRSSSIVDHGSGTRGSVLLVEDNRTIAMDLASLLRDQGFTVSVASNGEQAWSQLHEGLTPTVIVLDLMLPMMDGWTLRRRLHDHPGFASIPVVVLTGAAPADPAMVERADDVLSKPFEFQSLLAIVDRCVGVASV
ncbi:MAG: response regulator [Deltaproteobacteria bacterium]|nr:response regulator [Deltaproteobacteria bacterium]